MESAQPQEDAEPQENTESQEDAQSQGTPGTVIRGPDGALYFVPDSDLDAFRLPKDEQTRMEEALQQSTDSTTDVTAKRANRVEGCMNCIR